MASDPELLAAWRTGDREAGSQLFQRYVGVVSRFFLNKVGPEREDLVQQTFLACVEARDRIREGSTFCAYVLRVSRTKLYDHLRARFGKPVDTLAQSVVDLGDSPSQVVSRAERDQLLFAALRGIPVDLQIALELHYWEGLSMAELADVMDVPQGTVKSRLFRARELLRDELVKLVEGTTPIAVEEIDRALSASRPT